MFVLLHRTLTFLSEISRPVREINIYLAAWQVTEGPEVTIDFERAIRAEKLRRRWAEMPVWVFWNDQGNPMDESGLRKAMTAR